jgi:hypothetical protein
MAVVTVGPIIMAYPFFQKYFVKGLTVGAVKGRSNSFHGPNQALKK